MSSGNGSNGNSRARAPARDPLSATDHFAEMIEQARDGKGATKSAIRLANLLVALDALKAERTYVTREGDTRSYRQPEYVNTLRAIQAVAELDGHLGKTVPAGREEIETEDGVYAKMAAALRDQGYAVTRGSN